MNLLDRLPAVRGHYVENLPLSRLTWFRVGGRASVVFTPEDKGDLCHFLTHTPPDIPLLVMGMGSNMLVRDGGFQGVVIRLSKLNTITIDNATVTAGAGAGDLAVARHCAKAGLGGFEFLSGIPGTVGGALRMNAGAYGTEIKDIFICCRAVDRQGVVHTLAPHQMGFGYRQCGIPADWIFLEGTFQGTLVTEPNAIEAIGNRMADIQSKRTESQPTKARTGGSTFKNPRCCSAWQVIDNAGLRGQTLGGAKVSEKHCNFLINTGDATACDLENLGELVRDRVRRHCGVDLQWEIKRIGRRLRDGDSQ